MAQKLILPFGSSQLNAGYKMPKYKQQWGFAHYGIDLIEVNKQRTVYASGNGRVIAAGMDGATSNQRLGNCVVVVYTDVQLPDGRRMDVTCRMFHFDSIACKAGDSLRAGVTIGQYGSTGAHSSGPHLHMEFDTDTQYPQYAFGLAQSGNIIKKGGIDSTLDPCKVLWLGEEQSLTAPEAWITEGWVRRESLQLPRATAPTSDKEQLAQLEAKLAATLALQQRQAALLAQIHQMTAP